jgi:hypothetical protein
MIRAARVGRAHTTLALARAASLFPYDLRRTIVISGSPRSGTTWLADMIATIPRSSVLFEPLNLDEVPDARAVGFGWRTMLDADGGSASQVAFMQRVLSGHMLNRWTTQDMRPGAPTKTWVVKFVRANRMMPWIVANFPVRRPVIILRHPCAVVASQLDRNFPSQGPPPEGEFLRAHPEFTEVYMSVTTPEERLAFVWAADTFMPLRSVSRDRFDIVLYETLSHEPLPMMERLFANWNEPVPAALAAATERRSFTSSPTARGWQDRLSGDEQQRVLRVAHAFGLDFYDSGREPHTDHPLLRPSGSP